MADRSRLSAEDAEFEAVLADLSGETPVGSVVSPDREEIVLNNARVVCKRIEDEIGLLVRSRYRGRGSTNGLAIRATPDATRRPGPR